MTLNVSHCDGVEPEALSLRQLGRVYGFDRVFLGKLVANGELPAVRRGRALKVLRTDFERWFRRQARRHKRRAAR